MSAPVRVTTAEIRRVLDTPRGSRFSHTRTGTRSTAPVPPTREQLMLAQMADNPRVQYRLKHGQIPYWVKVAAQQRAEHERAARQQQEEPPRVPRPRPAPDDGPRPQPPPLPRRPRSHRKPRRAPWRLVTYTLAATAGALAHHLATFLL